MIISTKLISLKTDERGEISEDDGGNRHDDGDTTRLKGSDKCTIVLG